MDDFQEQINNARVDAMRKYEEVIKRNEDQKERFRRNADAAYQQAKAFNERVIAPLITSFSSASNLGDFTCEFKESDSQPEFVYSCSFFSQRITISLLYWVAGSALLSCNVGYGLTKPELKITSFDESDLDAKVDVWLKAELLKLYKVLLERYPQAFKMKA